MNAETPVAIVYVFVSSTYLDLQLERKAVEAALQRLQETKFVGMEYFGSRDEDTRRASLDEIEIWKSIQTVERLFQFRSDHPLP